ncbi:MAG: hypothetical protein ACJZ7A_05945 [Opitutales bacterium]
MSVWLGNNQCGCTVDLVEVIRAHGCLLGFGLVLCFKSKSFVLDGSPREVDGEWSLGFATKSSFSKAVDPYCWNTST